MYPDNNMNADLAGQMAGELMMAGIAPGEFNQDGLHAPPPVRGQKRLNKESMALPKNTKNSIVPKLDFKKSVDYSAQ